MKTITAELTTPVQPVPLANLARQLVADAVVLARAEANVAKVRVAPKIRTAKFALVLMVVAAVVALLSAIGLIVGLVMALTAHVGPLYAGLIVGGAGLAFAGLVGIVAAQQLSGLLKPLMEKLG